MCNLLLVAFLPFTFCLDALLPRCLFLKNKCLKYLDAQKRKQHSQQDLITLADDKDDYVLAQMVRSEFLQEVYREIESLPPYEGPSSKCYL